MLLAGASSGEEPVPFAAWQDPPRAARPVARWWWPGGSVTVVNHFGHERRWIRAIERWLSPLSQWIGFRLDLPIETVTDTPGLTTEEIERVNLVGWWRLIRMRRDG